MNITVMINFNTFMVLIMSLCLILVAISGIRNRLCTLNFFLHISYLKRAQQILINGHKRSCIVEFPAIIRSGKYCNQLTFCEEFITIFNNLMSTTNKIKIVFMQKFRNYIRSKCVGNPSIINIPSVLVFMGI